MRTSTPSNSLPRHIRDDSYNEPSEFPSLEDREAILPLNLKDDYLLPHSVDDTDSMAEMFSRGALSPREFEDKEKRINKAIEYYKMKYKIKYQSRYRWKYKEPLRHMEAKGTGAEAVNSDRADDRKQVEKDRASQKDLLQSNKSARNGTEEELLAWLLIFLLLSVAYVVCWMCT
ncbi:hypothetical protein TWF281_003153 [Arthrobotrys megalospora]